MKKGPNTLNLREKNIKMSQRLNLGGQAPQAYVLSITVHHGLWKVIEVKSNPDVMSSKISVHQVT